MTKTLRICIADDSSIIRGIVTRLLQSHDHLQVVSAATDGVVAIEHAKQHKPDIMILDIEMPNKDGLSALPEIVRCSPNTKVIMASTLTKKDSDIGKKVLALGATTYVQKPASGEAGEMDRFSRELIHIIHDLYPEYGTPTDLTPLRVAPRTNTTPSTHTATARTKPAGTPIHAVAIASSTGGPQALATVFEDLKNSLTHIPIFITQHMPRAFTVILANNLGSLSGKPCKEGADGELVREGLTYIAPGDYHMRVSKQREGIRIHLDQGEMVNFCRPAADPMIESLVESYGHHLLLVVLTGMGHDGLKGAQLAHQVGCTIIAQDQDSSVVWGMPKAVVQAGIAHHILPLKDISSKIKRLCEGGK
ncbi:MAG: chemotaxis response regulator protein-glutamate methylesterase [Alphaproteobacteria bacterium]|nr:MAG: chemotaxis response regulator protein-glutamate methylesterase [Alphaproteobacteria bacterium]